MSDARHQNVIVTFSPAILDFMFMFVTRHSSCGIVCMQPFLAVYLHFTEHSVCQWFVMTIID